VATTAREKQRDVQKYLTASAGSHIFGGGRKKAELKEPGDEAVVKASLGMPADFARR